MATQTATSPLSVVPDASTYQKINNTVDAPRALATAIEQFKTQRAAARTALTSAHAKDLAGAPLNVDSAIEKEKAWKTSDEALAAKIKAAEDLKETFEKQIEDLKKTQPEVLQTVLQTKVDKLEAEVKVKVENEQTNVLKEQIRFLRSLLDDVNVTTKKLT
jgi:chromosome segregation ATPase